MKEINLGSYGVANQCHGPFQWPLTIFFCPPRILNGLDKPVKMILIEQFSLCPDRLCKLRNFDVMHQIPYAELWQAMVPKLEIF